MSRLVTIAERVENLEQRLRPLADAALTSAKTASRIITSLEQISRTLRLLNERLDDLERVASGRTDPAAWNRVRKRAEGQDDGPEA